MKEHFLSHIKNNKLADRQETLMLAVSGGIDSVVMTDLFYEAGYSCIILHCNFGLRGQESDGDEAFVRSLAAKYEFPVYVKHFDTEGYAEENGISIQMAARDLRYAWFDEMAKQHDISRIATAHNLNDSVETVLLNLTRGTGIKGITGIPVVNGKYIRPLLFAPREKIVDYCKERRLSYREDSSNSSTKYKRNKIRHNIIPVLQEINPAFLQTMTENINHFREAHQIYRQEIEKTREILFKSIPGGISIDLEELIKLRPLSAWLYELFSDAGFSMDQCKSIQHILDSESGKQFVSRTHRLYKDRSQLLLFPVEESTFERYYIDSPESNAVVPFSLDMEVMDRARLEQFPDDPSIACLDLDQLNFPLIIRKWKHGDYFFPLGMEQMKKVSDFFIDTKVPVPVKNRTWILTSGRHIAWIIGHRLDNRYKVTDSTKRVLRLQVYES